MSLEIKQIIFKVSSKLKGLLIKRTNHLDLFKLIDCDSQKDTLFFNSLSTLNIYFIKFWEKIS